MPCWQLLGQPPPERHGRQRRSWTCLQVCIAGPTGLNCFPTTLLETNSNPFTQSQNIVFTVSATCGNWLQVKLEMNPLLGFITIADYTLVCADC